VLELDLTVSGVSKESKLFCESSEERFANSEIICPAVRKVTAFVAAQPVAGVSNWIIIRVKLAGLGLSSLPLDGLAVGKIRAVNVGTVGNNRW